MCNNQPRLSGMQAFIVIGIGQMISLLGTGLTRFALLIWVHDQTGKATPLALLGFFSFGSYVLCSPVAGVWVDRWDRRLVMLLADLGAGIMTVSLLVLYAMNHLQIWHLYLAQIVTGAFEAFQMPAYAAATTMLLPKEQYARASGMRSLAASMAQVLAPFCAGFMLILVGINGIMLIDIVTFLIAMTTLLAVRVPRPYMEPDDPVSRRNMLREIGFGFRYIANRRGLLGLLLIFMGINLFAALTYYSILPAMVLARSGGSALALANVQAALGIGSIAGGLLLSVWSGPKSEIHSILGGAALSFLLSDFLFALGRGVPIWVIAAFLGSFFVPFITGANLAIWQAKVAPGVQGRVFSVQGMFQQSTMPIGYLSAGPLADYLFEPAMATGGKLADVFYETFHPANGKLIFRKFLAYYRFGGIISNQVRIGKGVDIYPQQYLLFRISAGAAQ